MTVIDDRYLNGRSSFVSDISTGNSRIVSPKYESNLAKPTAAIKQTRLILAKK